MPDWFTGQGGSDANSGATWPLRKLTITSMMGVAFVAGDRLLVGPGVYREQVTIPATGGAVAEDRQGLRRYRRVGRRVFRHAPARISRRHGR